MVQSYSWPQYVVWETTLRCNLRCIHCGSIAGDHRHEELSTDECISLIHQLQDLRCRTIILSGGETLLRPDWKVITETILEGGSRVGIITNGITLHKNPGIIESLHELSHGAGRPSTELFIGISIDGMEKVHDYIRGLPGCFKKSWEAINRLGDRQIPVAVMTSVSKANLGDLEALKEKVYRSPAYAWQFQVITPYGRMQEQAEEILSRKDYAELVQFIARERAACRETIIEGTDNIGYYTPLEPVLRDCAWQGCAAGLRALGIQSNGNIKGCLSLLDDEHFIEGNIRENRLVEIWHKKDGFQYNRGFEVEMLEGYCHQCPHGARCRAGCTSTAHAFSGSVYQNPLCVYGIERDGLIDPIVAPEINHPPRE